MSKILGIDTGTNSLGWAIVDKQAEDYQLLDKGVNIFQEGVNIIAEQKNQPSSKRQKEPLIELQEKDTIV